MKRKNVQNKNGITISDSIVMSVKRKHANYRKPFSAAIALIGYVSIIMAFLGMFKFHYNSSLLKPQLMPKTTKLILGWKRMSLFLIF